MYRTLGQLQKRGGMAGLTSVSRGLSGAIIQNDTHPGSTNFLKGDIGRIVFTGGTPGNLVGYRVWRNGDVIEGNRSDYMWMNPTKGYSFVHSDGTWTYGDPLYYEDNLDTGISGAGRYRVELIDSPWIKYPDPSRPSMTTGQLMQEASHYMGYADFTIQSDSNVDPSWDYVQDFVQNSGKPETLPNYRQWVLAKTGFAVREQDVPIPASIANWPDTSQVNAAKSQITTATMTRTTNPTGASLQATPSMCAQGTDSDRRAWDCKDIPGWSGYITPTGGPGFNFSYLNSPVAAAAQEGAVSVPSTSQNVLSSSSPAAFLAPVESALQNITPSGLPWWVIPAAAGAVLLMVVRK